MREETRTALDRVPVQVIYRHPSSTGPDLRLDESTTPRPGPRTPSETSSPAKEFNNTELNHIRTTGTWQYFRPSDAGCAAVATKLTPHANCTTPDTTGPPVTGPEQSHPAAAASLPSTNLDRPSVLCHHLVSGHDSLDMFALKCVPTGCLQWARRSSTTY